MAALRNSWLLLLGLCAASCGSTGGKLITIGFRAGGVSRAASGPLTFSITDPTTKKVIWTVTLQTARVGLGPFYFNAESPPTAAFRGGTVIIQATEQVIVDPLDPALKSVPGGADGETGPSLVCEIDLFPPPQSVVIGYVSGVATNGTTSVPFAGPIAINPNLVTPEQPLVAWERVNGAAAVLSFTADTQEVDLRVDPSHWFDSADFSALLGSAPVAGVYGWDPSNCNANSLDSARCTFQNAVLSGVRATIGVYQFSVVP
jgi:hypothetical protein